MTSYTTPTDRFLLQDRVVLVTGGSRGLGREMVKAFAGVGAHVVIASRKFDQCKELADEIEATTDRQALPYACHVGNWDEIDPMVDAAYERFGKLDVVVNNAGMSPLYDHVVNVTESLWDKVIDVNLKGPYRLLAYAGTRMVESGNGGSIITVSSGGAIRPAPNIVPYAAAKAGLNAMTVGFSRTFGPTVRVNCIMPGPFYTDISKAWDIPTVKERQKEQYSLERAGEPEEIIGAALYFASDASSFTTGAILAVDGGMP
ncbi:MAG: SDR family oxidoreductase [Ilumatobacteraceae bacterium]